MSWNSRTADIVIYLYPQRLDLVVFVLQSTVADLGILEVANPT